MKKKELIDEVKEILKGLASYDPEYYEIGNDRHYNKMRKDELVRYIQQLKDRLSFTQRAKGINAHIISRAQLKSIKTDLIVKSGVVCRNVGIGYVAERIATEQDIRSMYVIV